MLMDFTELSDASLNSMLQSLTIIKQQRDLLKKLNSEAIRTEPSCLLGVHDSLSDLFAKVTIQFRECDEKKTITKNVPFNVYKNGTDGEPISTGRDSLMVAYQHDVKTLDQYDVKIRMKDSSVKSFFQGGELCYSVEEWVPFKFITGSYLSH